MLIARGTANYTAMDHCLDGPQRSMREDGARRKGESQRCGQAQY